MVKHTLMNYGVQFASSLHRPCDSKVSLVMYTQHPRDHMDLQARMNIFWAIHPCFGGH